MSRRKGALCALLGAVLALNLCACAPQEKTVDLFAMDTVMSLTAYGPQAQEGLDAAGEQITRIEGLMSVTREDSEIYAVNHSEGRPTPVSQETGSLLELTSTLSQRTGGALSITLYPVLRAWGFTTQAYRVPGEEELQELLTLVDDSAVDYAPPAGTVTLPAGMELDLGSVAKGYAGALAAQTLEEAGVTSALLDLGGNIQTVGSRPDGDPWRIGVRDPLLEQDYVGVVTVSGEAVVTSGGYERYFEQDGVTYWHILDPKTGKPAHSGLLSATVVGKDGALCDGLSTSLFVLGLEGAVDYWRTWGGFEFILVTDDGQVYISQGLQDRYTCAGGSYGEDRLHIVEAQP